jgi:hypothetical protein
MKRYKSKTKAKGQVLTRIVWVKQARQPVKAKIFTIIFPFYEERSLREICLN